mgnify:CR=1 FL=1
MSWIPFLDTGLKIIERIIPDPTERQKAKLKLLELEQNGEFKQLEEASKNIRVEAASTDKWTSRARPSFHYVMYFIICSSVPFSIFFMVDPVNAKEMVEGFKFWLHAIPDAMWTLFGAGYLGYVGARSYDKRK